MNIFHLFGSLIIDLVVCISSPALMGGFFVLAGLAILEFVSPDRHNDRQTMWTISLAFTLGAISGLVIVLFLLFSETARDAFVDMVGICGFIALAVTLLLRVAERSSVNVNLQFDDVNTHEKFPRLW